MLEQYKWKIPNRKESNKEMVKILEELVNAHPELRFGQILMAFGFITTDIGREGLSVVDPFNEESVDTLKRVQEVINKLKIKDNAI